jgi:hypothetical protein
MTSREVVDSVYIDRVAKQIRKYGLAHPVRLGLEASRPLTFIGGQLLWMAQPILGLFATNESIGMFARLLEEPEAVDRLLTFLDQE